MKKAKCCSYEVVLQNMLTRTAAFLQLPHSKRTQTCMSNDLTDTPRKGNTTWTYSGSEPTGKVHKLFLHSLGRNDSKRTKP